MTVTGEPTQAEAGLRQEKPLTIAQIAELTGVSIPTVSKVVNGRSEVAPETRAMVENAIRVHGYRRRRKRASSAALLELVFHELEGPYALELIKGVEQVAREHRLGVVLSQLQGRHTPGRGWIEDVLNRRPTGVIAVFSGPDASQRDKLRTREIPLVLVDPTGEPGHTVPSVGASNWSGGLSATRHLIDLGHRRIATITGPAHMLSSRARLDGYRAAMDTTGVPIDPALIREGAFLVDDGLRHTRDLLRLPDPPTAIFACNDGTAIGIYQAADEAGRRIPHDLSVVGFDDLLPAPWMIPPLTTIRQPLTEMAVAAANMVVKLARHEVLPSNRLELSTTLILRGSTAPPA
jgi:LacI family transcriptional regulator, xylobiose transport system transcriptional regulator